MAVIFEKNGLKVEDKGENICISFPKNADLGPSKSGKSHIVATTSGNIDIGGGVKLGLNAYK